MARSAQTPAPVPIVRRRRGEELEAAIYQAVIDQLCVVGYAGLTMEGIANAAQTGKAALYRRWSDKTELVLDAVDHVLPSSEDLPDSGSLRDDMIELMRAKAAVLNSPVGRAVQSLLVEIDREQPFVKLVNERIFQPRRNMFQLIVDRAARRGEVRADGISPLAAETGPALLMYRFLGEPTPVPDDFLVSVVDDVILPLTRA